MEFGCKHIEFEMSLYFPTPNLMTGTVFVNGSCLTMTSINCHFFILVILLHTVDKY